MANKPRRVWHDKNSLSNTGPPGFERAKFLRIFFKINKCDTFFFQIQSLKGVTSKYPSNTK